VKKIGSQVFGSYAVYNVTFELAIAGVDLANIFAISYALRISIIPASEI
jgi:hypothetical protein